MNQIRAIQKLNQREIELGISPDASWHTDYRDTAFVNFGGLPYELTEGDIITIFSQYGEPVFLKLARDKETGKSKGFGWLKYEDQRSCDLAVDNIGGAEIGGRLIRVDHARYKARDDEDPEECKIGWEDMIRKEKMAKGEDIEMEDDRSVEEQAEKAARRPLIKEERELQKLIEEHDEEDPMKAFLIEEKKAEVELALQRQQSHPEKRHERKHRHRDHHHRSHRSRRDRSAEGDSRGDRHKRSRRDETPALDRESRRDRDRTPERRRDSRDRDRRRREDAGYDRDRDRDRHKHKTRDHEREAERDRRQGRSRRDEDGKRPSRRGSPDTGREGERERDRDRHYGSRRHSRSKSPRGS